MAGMGEPRGVQSALLDRVGGDRRGLSRLHQFDGKLDGAADGRRIGGVRFAGNCGNRKRPVEDRQGFGEKVRRLGRLGDRLQGNGQAKRLGDGGKPVEIVDGEETRQGVALVQPGHQRGFATHTGGFAHGQGNGHRPADGARFGFRCGHSLTSMNAPRRRSRM